MLSAVVRASKRGSRIVLHKRSRSRLESIRGDLARFSRLAGESEAGAAAREAAEWIGQFIASCSDERPVIESRKDRQLPVGDR